MVLSVSFEMPLSLKKSLSSFILTLKNMMVFGLPFLALEGSPS
jgi:hypothetical protein